MGWIWEQRGFYFSGVLAVAGAEGQGGPGPHLQFFGPIKTNVLNQKTNAQSRFVSVVHGTSAPSMAHEPAALYPCCSRAAQQFQMNRYISQFLEFYRRKEKPLGLDSNQFSNFLSSLVGF